jgi:hypothetical protein
MAGYDLDMNRRDLLEIWKKRQGTRITGEVCLFSQHFGFINPIAGSREST